MSANRQHRPTDDDGQSLVGKYFTFNKSLYYVENYSVDGEMVLVENCKTEELQWITTELFERGMKEVKC